MKSLSAIRQTLQENTQLDEITLKTAGQAFIKRANAHQYDKALSNLAHVKKKLARKEAGEIVKESEQIDELSADTLRNYYPKAIAGHHTHDIAAASSHDSKEKEQHEKKSMDRYRGMIRANNKLSVERNPYSLNEINSAFSLPMVLLLRRKTIRNFSDGTAVALYYNDRIDRYFSIPVRNVAHPENEPIQVGEDFNCDTNFDALQLIAEDIQTPLHFTDGSEINLDKDTATKVLMLYTHLNESNQQKFLENIDNRAAFEKIIAFVQK